MRPFGASEKGLTDNFKELWTKNQFFERQKLGNYAIFQYEH